MNTPRGFLIALEGIDGCGKTTLAQGLYRELEKNGLPVLLTREPGGSPLGKNVRALLHDRPAPITPQAEFLLFAADRAQHFSEIILPALAENKIVISDRMADSSLAYQGYGRGLNKEMIQVINRWAMQGKQPDLVIFVKIPVSVALERTAKRGEKLTSFEQEKADFFERIAQGFEEIFENAPHVITLDGLQTQEEMLATALGKLSPKLILNQ